MEPDTDFRINIYYLTLDVKLYIITFLLSYHRLDVYPLYAFQHTGLLYFLFCSICSFVLSIIVTFVYFINLAISIVKFDIIHITDIQNVTPNMIPIFLGIGSTLLNVRIMYINVFKFIICDTFLYS